MNHAVTPEIERRINRNLDGALSDAEQADLYRDLLRNPTAHALADDYAACDKLAAGALRQVVGGQSPMADSKSADPIDLNNLPARDVYRPQWQRLALAASVALLAVAGVLASAVRLDSAGPSTALNPGTKAVSDSVATGGGVERLEAPLAVARPPTPLVPTSTFLYDSGAIHVGQTEDREFQVVYDSQGQAALIELRRTHTTIENNQQRW